MKSLEGTTWRALKFELIEWASLGIGSASGASFCICCCRRGLCGKRGGLTKEDDELNVGGADATPGTPGPDRRPLELAGCSCPWFTLN